MAFLVVLGGVVAVGVAGRRPVEPAIVMPVALDSPGLTSAAASVAPTLQAVIPSSLPGASAARAPILTTGPGPIQLVARRHPETMFVHGDVFVPRVTWVFVSLQDDSGRVAGWASVSVPGAAGPGVGSGPTLRFDVELAVPAGFAGRLWIQANAYDTQGAQIASSRLEVPPGGEAPILSR
jgi:hypothetical protein